MPRIYTYQVDETAVTAHPVAEPWAHPLTLAAEPDWRLGMLNPHFVKRAYEVREGGDVIGLCVTHLQEHWPD